MPQYPVFLEQQTPCAADWMQPVEVEGQQIGTSNYLLQQKTNADYSFNHRMCSNNTHPLNTKQ